MRNVAMVGGTIPFAEDLELGSTDLVLTARAEAKT